MTSVVLHIYLYILLKFSKTWAKHEVKVRFDGGEKRIASDQYVERCKGDAVNLHIYRLGQYPGCTGCKYKKECDNSARVAGEQAEF